MSEQRPPYETSNLHVASAANRGTLETERGGIVEVYSPKTGKFVCKYDADRHALIWFNRGQREAIPLPPCRKAGE